MNASEAVLAAIEVIDGQMEHAHVAAHTHRGVTGLVGPPLEVSVVGTVEQLLKQHH